MKHLLITILILTPFLLLAQANSDSTSKATYRSKSAIRKQKAAERKEHINQLIKQEEEGALIFQKQSNFGLKFNTDGFSFQYEHGKYKTITSSNIWWLELGERKQHNQQRQTPNPSITNYGQYSVISIGNSFILGKENNFYKLNLGFGKQKLIGNKGTTNGIAVSAVYGAGISLGLLKPYYVQVPDSISNIKDIKLSDDSIAFLDPTQILGSSGFGKGLNEIKVIPGLHTRAALRFDYGRYREAISALEVGINVDYYLQKIGIMALNDKHNLYFSGYIVVEFGRRR